MFLDSCPSLLSVFSAALLPVLKCATASYTPKTITVIRKLFLQILLRNFFEEKFSPDGKILSEKGSLKKKLCFKSFEFLVLRILPCIVQKDNKRASKMRHEFEIIIDIEIEKMYIY